MRIFLAVGVVYAALSAPAWSQSFNCAYARSASQVAICNDSTLMGLDSEHELLFSRVLAAADAAVEARMHREYGTWQEFRDLCGPDRLCIARRYNARIDELEAQSRPVYIIGEAPAAAAPLTGPMATITGTLDVPDLRLLGAELGGDRPALAKPVLTPLEGFAVLANQGADPVPAEGVATVDPDGTIKKRLSDGRIAYYNPLTEARGFLNPDGTAMRIAPMQVQVDAMPALPPDYAGWSASVSASLAGLVGNLLTVAEAQTLQGNAPGGFFENLDFQLRVLAFITG